VLSTGRPSELVCQSDLSEVRLSAEFQEILKDIRGLQRAARHDRRRELWFRGQRKAEWELRSRLHREILEHDFASELRLTKLDDAQGTFFLRFRRPPGLC